MCRLLSNIVSDDGKPDFVVNGYPKEFETLWGIITAIFVILFFIGCVVFLLKASSKKNNEEKNEENSEESE